MKESGPSVYLALSLQYRYHKTVYYVPGTQSELFIVCFVVWGFLKENKSAYCLLVIPLINKHCNEVNMAFLLLFLFLFFTAYYFTIMASPSSPMMILPSLAEILHEQSKQYLIPDNKLAVYTDCSQMSHFLLPVRLCIQTLNV